MTARTSRKICAHKWYLLRGYYFFPAVVYTLSAMRMEKMKRSTNASSRNIDAETETEIQQEESPDCRQEYTKQT